MAIDPTLFLALAGMGKGGGKTTVTQSQAVEQVVGFNPTVLVNVGPGGITEPVSGGPTTGGGARAEGTARADDTTLIPLFGGGNGGSGFDLTRLFGGRASIDIPPGASPALGTTQAGFAGLSLPTLLLFGGAAVAAFIFLR